MMIVRGIAIGLAWLALALPLAPARAAPAPVTIRIGWVVVPQSLQPIYFAKPGIAQHLGKSYVLQPIHFAGSTPEIPALATGEIDVATLAFSSFGLAIQNAGLDDLRIISDELQDGVAGYYTNEFMVLKNGPIHTVEDLKGKTLATNAIGGAADMAIRAEMRRHHLEDKRDYTIIEVNFPNMKAMLFDHKADLVSAVVPFSFDPALRQDGRTLFTQKDAFGTTQLTMLVARAGFIAQHRAALVDYLEDLLRSVRWYTDPANHAEAVAIIARFTKAPPEMFDRWVFTRNDLYRNPDGLPNLEALARNLATQRDLGFLRIKIDVEKHADLGPIKEAAQRLK